MVKRKKGFDFHERARMIGLSVILIFLVLGLIFTVRNFELVEREEPLFSAADSDAMFVEVFDIDGNNVIEEEDGKLLNESLSGRLEGYALVNEDVLNYIVNNYECDGGVDEAECNGNYDFNDDGSVDEYDFEIIGAVVVLGEDNENFDSVLMKLQTEIEGKIGLERQIVEFTENVFDVNIDGVVNETDKNDIVEALNGQGDKIEEIRNNIYNFIWNNKRCNLIGGECDLNYDFNDDGGIDTVDTFIFFDAAGNPSDENFDLVLNKIVAAVDEEIELQSAVEDDENEIQETQEVECSADFEYHDAECVDDEIVTYAVAVNITGTDCTASNITLPENTSVVSDCDGNKIRGRFGRDVKKENFGQLKWKIDGDESDGSEEISGEEDVEIFDEDDVKRVRFEHNFSKEFDLEKVVIKKQKNSHDRGYLIVDGINATKTVRVDRLNDESDSVCIEDEEGLESGGSISNNCGNSDEYLIYCDGDESDEGYSCEISGDENYFIVYGLSHSGVEEYLDEDDDEESYDPNAPVNNVNRASSGSGTSSNSNTNTGAGSSGVNTGSGSDSGLESSSSSGDRDNLGSAAGSSTGNESGGVMKWVLIGVLIVAILIVVMLILYFYLRGKKSNSGNGGYNGGSNVNVVGNMSRGSPGMGMQRR